MLYILDLPICEKTKQPKKSSKNVKKKKQTADTSQLTKLKEPCGSDCVRKWFTLNKYTYTHTAGQGGAEIKGVLVKKLSNTLMLHSNRWSPFTL